MTTENYTRVIKEWCSATGMTPWQPSERTHVEIEETTVGLIYEENSPTTLYAYVDLGAWSSADIYQRLLSANFIIDPYCDGYFSVDPESGSIVFRLRFSLADTEGEQLPGQLAAAIQTAKQRLMP